MTKTSLPLCVVDSFRSRRYISNHYREFDGLPEEIVEEDIKGKDEETLDMIISPKTLDFSYSLSPGYQKW